MLEYSLNKPPNASRFVMHFVDYSRFRRRSRRSPARGTAQRTNGSHSLLRRRFILHTRVFEHVSPLSTGSSMAVFQVLPKMIGTEEFLRLIAFAEFVHVI